MDVFTMIVIVVVIGCATGVCSEYLKTRRLEAKREPSDDLTTELDALRERVEVLEKIITDDKYHLHRELSDLERSA